MIKLFLFIFFIFSSGILLAEEPSASSKSDSQGFAPIIIKVMNRGTNILMSTSFLFILLYTIYVAIAVSFGSMGGDSFIAIFWGSGIVFAGGALAKIYYLFLT